MVMHWILGSSWCLTMPGLMWLEYACSSFGMTMPDTTNCPPCSADIDPIKHLNFSRSSVIPWSGSGRRSPRTPSVFSLGACLSDLSVCQIHAHFAWQSVQWDWVSHALIFYSMCRCSPQTVFYFLFWGTWLILKLNTPFFVFIYMSWSRSVFSGFLSWPCALHLPFGVEPWFNTYTSPRVFHLWHSARQYLKPVLPSVLHQFVSLFMPSTWSLLCL